MYDYTVDFLKSTTRNNVELKSWKNDTQVIKRKKNI